MQLRKYPQEIYSKTQLATKHLKCSITLSEYNYCSFGHMHKSFRPRNSPNRAFA